MDPTLAVLLVNGLGQGLALALKVLAEKGLAEAGFEPLKELVKRGWDERKDAAHLQAAFQAALDEALREGAGDLRDRLYALPRLAGGGRQSFARLAAAAVEMAREDPQAVPGQLLKDLGWGEDKRPLLARFLFLLRQELAESKLEGYRQAIAYANWLTEQGQLRLLEEVEARIARAAEATAEHTGFLAGVGAAQLAESRLVLSDEEAEQNYRQDARRLLTWLPLPLARKREMGPTQAELMSVFVPLTLHDKTAEEKARQEQERRMRARGRKGEPAEGGIDVPPARWGEALGRYPRLVLLGDPGSGKTTLLRRAGLAFIDEAAFADLEWPDAPDLLPVFIRLRGFGDFLSSDKGRQYTDPAPGALLAYLYHYFRDERGVKLSADFFERRLERNGLLFLLDGLDEVSQEPVGGQAEEGFSRRSQVARQVCAFLERYAPRDGQPGNRFVLGSRPRGFRSVEAFFCNAALAECVVNPLGEAGIRQLIAKLFDLIEPDPRQRQIDCETLARKILDPASPDLREIADNPLFCTTLVQVFKYYNAELPQRRVDVLQEIVDLLLGFWKYQEQQAPDRVLPDGSEKMGRHARDVVEIKKRRLCQVADLMQTSGQVEIPQAKAVERLAQHIRAQERERDEALAERWAEHFLINSHERSGLLVEIEPEKYAFVHQYFREYLAALALLGKGEEALARAALEHVGDPLWEGVILLAGAHEGRYDQARARLTRALIQDGLAFRRRGEAEAMIARLALAGRAARDMGDRLPGPQYDRVVNTLHAAMTDPDLEPRLRAEAADALDALGWLPRDLYQFILIRSNDVSHSPQATDVATTNGDFWIGKYPVANAQYARFVQDEENFRDRDLWVGFPMFDEHSRLIKNQDWGEAGWEWLQRALKDKERSPDGVRVLPRYWNDPRFGAARRGAPVVGVTWWEANAYCRWLLRHWAELEEGQENPGLQPALIRLPTEAEWALAAGGETPRERYPWDAPGQFTQDEAEILKRANVYESGIGRTTPVGMYPQGVSEPYKLWDLAGNAWEWQANYSSSSQQYLALRGGSWLDLLEDARVAVRSSYRPASDWLYDGLRVVVLPRGAVVS